MSLLHVICWCSLRLYVQGVKIETRRPYLLTGWNIMDFLITISLVVDSLGMVFGSTLRYSWPLRPLRVLSLSTKIQVVCICMMDSIPSLFNVSMLGLCMFFVFSVMGLQVSLLVSLFVILYKLYNCTIVDAGLYGDYVHVH